MGWLDPSSEGDHAEPYHSLDLYEVYLPGGGHVSVEKASCEASARVMAEHRSGINRRWLMARRSPKTGFR